MVAIAAMSDAPLSLPVLISIGIFQFAVCGLVARWLARRALVHLRWLRIMALVVALCGLSLPFAYKLLWFPPEDPEKYRNLVLAAAFVPVAAAELIALVRMWQLHRNQRPTDPGKSLP